MLALSVLLQLAIVSHDASSAAYSRLREFFFAVDFAMTYFGHLPHLSPSWFGNLFCLRYSPPFSSCVFPHVPQFHLREQLPAREHRHLRFSWETIVLDAPDSESITCFLVLGFHKHNAFHYISIFTFNQLRGGPKLRFAEVYRSLQCNQLHTKHY
jgi:hypothetical protein